MAWVLQHYTAFKGCVTLIILCDSHKLHYVRKVNDYIPNEAQRLNGGPLSLPSCLEGWGLEWRSWTVYGARWGLWASSIIRGHHGYKSLCLASVVFSVWHRADFKVEQGLWKQPEPQLVRCSWAQSDKRRRQKRGASLTHIEWDRERPLDRWMESLTKSRMRRNFVWKWGTLFIYLLGIYWLCIIVSHIHTHFILIIFIFHYPMSLIRDAYRRMGEGLFTRLWAT